MIGVSIEMTRQWLGWSRTTGTLEHCHSLLARWVQWLWGDVLRVPEHISLRTAPSVPLLGSSDQGGWLTPSRWIHSLAEISQTVLLTDRQTDSVYSLSTLLGSPRLQHTSISTSWRHLDRSLTHRVETNVVLLMVGHIWLWSHIFIVRPVWHCQSVQGTGVLNVQKILININKRIYCGKNDKI